MRLNWYLDVCMETLFAACDVSAGYFGVIRF